MVSSSALVGDAAGIRESGVRSRQSVTTSYEQEMRFGEFFSTDGRTYEVMTQRLMLGFGTGG
jgi:hypothetical protein